MLIKHEIYFTVACCIVLKLKNHKLSTDKKVPVRSVCDVILSALVQFIFAFTTDLLFIRY